jgi:hypothetical protein
MGVRVPPLEPKIERITMTDYPLETGEYVKINDNLEKTKCTFQLDSGGEMESMRGEVFPVYDSNSDSVYITAPSHSTFIFHINDVTRLENTKKEINIQHFDINDL